MGSVLENIRVKRCSKCGEEKELGEFYKDKFGKYGVRSICKICQKELHKINYIKNKKKVKDQKQRWAKAHRQQINIRQQQLRKANSDRYRQYQRQWALKHPEQCKNWGRKRGRQEIINLADRYIKNILRSIGISQITPQMIQLKREQIMVHRALQSLKEAINE